MKPQSLVFCIVLALVLAVGAFPRFAWAQSLTTGDIAGTIEDPSGAALPNATVTLTNQNTGATETTNTNATGAYRFALLNPGSYTVSATASGFQLANQSVTVAVGQAAMANLRLQVAGAAQTVEVSAQPGVIQTENGNVTASVTPEIIANMPNPGNDLTYYVQTAPGATMNTQAGYGNSASYGISGTSDLTTINGMTDNDPFLNLSNSGATNLLLGANDIQEVGVTNNGYEGQYGVMAGANVNYVSKSGGNKFHGNAEYFWNGRILNANDWFNNHTSPQTPRAFDNANQWAASFGGPIVKDKTFFFIDTEGLRMVIPAVTPVYVPSPQFQSATLGNLSSNGHAAEIPFYTNVFNLYDHSPGFSRATNTLSAGGCDGSVSLAGGAPCALQFQSSISNLTDEWLLSRRLDQNIGSNDRAFIHIRADHGLQATYTDPLSKTLNAQSTQPQYQGQIQENHTVSPDATNQFILAGGWYSAVFQPPSLSSAISLMPYSLSFAGGSPNGFFYSPGGASYSTWPQGRNVTNYQIEDDFSWQRGNHNFKFGVNFNRNDITDYTPGGFLTQIPDALFATEANSANPTPCAL
jgi:Carboxypeptidase regulatory-like domain